MITRPSIWLLGTTGLRLGEAAGLQVGDVREGKIRVARQRHGLTVEPPKGGRGRDVPVPAFVQAKMDLKGRGADRVAVSWREIRSGSIPIAGGLESSSQRQRAR